MWKEKKEIKEKPWKEKRQKESNSLEFLRKKMHKPEHILYFVVPFNHENCIDVYQLLIAVELL